MDKVELIQLRLIKVIRLLVHVPCEEMLTKFSLFSLRKNKAKERHYCCLELCNGRWSQSLFKAHSDKKQQTQVSTQEIFVKYKEKNIIMTVVRDSQRSWGNLHPWRCSGPGIQTWASCLSWAFFDQVVVLFDFLCFLTETSTEID